ncbi:MAG: adenosine deaminase [Spirochaetia bacterium]|jgi:adenosine deaminase|nr:adenosine deaminase [Spirochaetia bacterium]
MIHYINKIPKAELHLHIEGTLEPETMFRLAKRNNIDLPYLSVDEVKRAYEFDNLQSFLDIYYKGAQVLINEIDFYELTWEYIEKIHRDNVKHTEIFFDPQSHTNRGIAFETVINGIKKALTEAKDKYGISSLIIMCFLKHLSEEEAIETLKQALPYKKWIYGVGLDSSEIGNPPEKFKRVCDMAMDNGFITVAHAGEEGPSQYIWDSIKLLHISRIDHGVRCSDDEVLLEYLKRSRIPLTVCPLSNLKLRVFDKMKDHNILELLHMGLCVTVNSDDPAYFGGYINQNFIELWKSLDLTKKDISQLAKNSFSASFLSLDEKQKYYNEIDSLE